MRDKRSFGVEIYNQDTGEVVYRRCSKNQIYKFIKFVTCESKIIDAWTHFGVRIEEVNAEVEDE